MEDRAKQYFNEGLNFARLGQYSEALDSFDKAIAIKPDYADAWNGRGYALLNLGRHAEAVDSYDKGIAIKLDYSWMHNPDDANAWNGRGYALLNLGRHAEAVHSYDKGLAINPNDVNAWNNHGYALLNLGQHAEAVDSFDKGLAINPDDANAWNGRGYALLNLGRHAEAVDSFDKGLAINPDDANAWSSRGYALNKLSRYSDAVASCDKAIAIDPNNPAVWVNRGNALGKLGRHAESLASCDKAIEMDPKYVLAWNNKVDALKELKRYDEAVAAYDRIIQLDPQNESAFAKKEELLNEIHDKQKQNREEEDQRTLNQQPQIIRAYEFYSGYIRVKISVKNPTPLTIHDVILEPDVDRAILYLERHEPEEYLSENEKIILGTINPHNDRTVSLYFEPTICAKEGTDVHCHIRYKDAQGQPGSLDMEPLRIQVICPIFETKEPVNIGSLKQLIESLPSRDTKIFSVPRNLDAQTQLKIFQGVIQLHDIRHISTLKRARNFESWYYGRTKVTQKDMVIKLGVAKDMDMVEISAFSHDPKDLTGLLAEISRHVTEEVSKRGNVQKIFNVTIKDSVVQRTNLMSFCDAEGKCSGDVTIEDSVVMRSNILSPDHEKSEESAFQQTDKKTTTPPPQRGGYAGVCPKCGSKLVWRVAQKTGELYRGCDNFDGGCRYQERSY